LKSLDEIRKTSENLNNKQVLLFMTNHEILVKSGQRLTKLSVYVKLDALRELESLPHIRAPIQNPELLRLHLDTTTIFCYLVFRFSYPVQVIRNLL